MVDDGCTSVARNENEYDAEPGFLGYIENNDEVQQQLEHLTEIFQKSQEQQIHEQRVFFKRLEMKMEERMERMMEKMMEKMEDSYIVSTVDRYTKTYTNC
jgi:uncharacterized coiled-coil protein SlyX|tara:strand:+ start:1165 stop:1464 length:300 start_codon:yes stop_codon:yes gene_type:complete